MVYEEAQQKNEATNTNDNGLLRSLPSTCNVASYTTKSNSSYTITCFRLSRLTSMLHALEGSFVPSCERMIPNEQGSYQRATGYRFYMRQA